MQFITSIVWFIGLSVSDAVSLSVFPFASLSACLSVCLSLSVSLTDLLFAGPACLSSVMRMINYDDDDSGTVYCEAKKKKKDVQYSNATVPTTLCLYLKTYLNAIFCLIGREHAHGRTVCNCQWGMVGGGGGRGGGGEAGEGGAGRASLRILEMASLVTFASELYGQYCSPPACLPSALQSIGRRCVFVYV